MGLYKADGTLLNYSTLAALTTADPDPLITLNVAIYEDVQYEAGGSAIADAASPKVLKWNAGDEIRTSELSKAYGVPVVTACAPNTGVHTATHPVTITGSGFTKGSRVVGGGGVTPTGVATVAIGGTAATAVVVVSDTEITCVAPVGSAGAANVAVTTAAGTGTLAGGFTYT